MGGLCAAYLNPSSTSSHAIRVRRLNHISRQNRSLNLELPLRAGCIFLPPLFAGTLSGAIQADVEVKLPTAETRIYFTELFHVSARCCSVVARMECNGIREERSAAFPDFTTFHPGYVSHHISLNHTRHCPPRMDAGDAHGMIRALFNGIFDIQGAQ